jgi:hypothetical protein
MLQPPSSWPEPGGILGTTPRSRLGKLPAHQIATFRFLWQVGRMEEGSALSPVQSNPLLYRDPMKAYLAFK